MSNDYWTSSMPLAQTKTPTGLKSTSSLLGSFAVVDGEAVEHIQVGLQEGHGEGCREGRQTLSNGRTMPARETRTGREGAMNQKP